jgi:hypothetical protein
MVVAFLSLAGAVSALAIGTRRPVATPKVQPVVEIAASA